MRADQPTAISPRLQQARHRRAIHQPRRLKLGQYRVGSAERPEQEHSVLDPTDTSTGRTSNSSGDATLSNVVAGTYRLSRYVLGEWGELRDDGVSVTAGNTTTITGLTFKPENFSPARAPSGPSARPTARRMSSCTARTPPAAPVPAQTATTGSTTATGTTGPISPPTTER